MGNLFCKRKTPMDLDRERMAFGKSLQEKGHTCVVYLESLPVQIRWCGEKVCMGRKKSKWQVEQQENFNKIYAYKYSTYDQSITIQTLFSDDTS
jgi:hypothetical protein